MPQTDIMYFMPEGTRQSQSLRKLRVIKNSTNMFWSHYGIDIPKNINEDRHKAVKSLMWISSSDDGERATEISRFSLDENDNIKEDSDGNWELEKLSLVPPQGDNTPQEEYSRTQLESWNWWSEDTFENNQDISLPLFGEFNVRKGYEFDYENPLYDGTTEDLYYVYDKETTVLSYPINFKASFGFDNTVYSDAIISANLIITNASAATSVFYSYNDVTNNTDRTSYGFNESTGYIEYDNGFNTFTLDKLDGSLESSGADLSFANDNGPIYIYLLAESGEGIKLTWNRVHPNIRINGSSISLNGTLTLSNSSAFVKKIKNSQGVFVDLFMLKLTSDTLIDSYYLACNKVFEFGFKYETVNESATDGVIQCYNDYTCTHYVNLKLGDPLLKPSFEQTDKQIINNDFTGADVYDGKSACDYLKDTLGISEPTETQIEDILYNGLTYNSTTYGPFLTSYPTSSSTTVSMPFDTVSDGYEQKNHQENTDLVIRIPFTESVNGKYSRIYVDGSEIKEQKYYHFYSDETIANNTVLQIDSGSYLDLSKDSGKTLTIQSGGSLRLLGTSTEPIIIDGGEVVINGGSTIILQHVIFKNGIVKLNSLVDSDCTLNDIMVKNNVNFIIDGGDANMSNINVESSENDYMEIKNGYTGNISDLTFISNGSDLEGDQSLIKSNNSDPVISHVYLVDSNGYSRVGDLSSYKTNTLSGNIFEVSNGTVKLNGVNLTSNTDTLSTTSRNNALLLNYDDGNFTSVSNDNVTWKVKRVANELIVKASGEQLSFEAYLNDTNNDGSDDYENIYFNLPNIKASYYDSLESNNYTELLSRLKLTETTSTLDFVHNDIKDTETYTVYDSSHSGSKYDYLINNINSSGRTNSVTTNFNLFNSGNNKLEDGEKFQLRIEDEKLISDVSEPKDLPSDWDKANSSNDYTLTNKLNVFGSDYSVSDYAIKIQYRTTSYNTSTNQFEYSDWLDTNGVEFSVDGNLKNKTHNDLLNEGFTEADAITYLDMIKERSGISGLPEFRMVLPNHFNIYTFQDIIRYSVLQIWYTKSSKLVDVGGGVFELVSGGNHKELLLIHYLTASSGFAPNGKLDVYKNTTGTEEKENVFDSNDGDSINDSGSTSKTVSRQEGTYDNSLVLAQLDINNNIVFNNKRMVEVSLAASTESGYENDYDNYQIINNLNDVEKSNDDIVYKIVRKSDFDYENLNNNTSEKFKLLIKWYTSESETPDSEYTVNLVYSYTDVKEITFDGLLHKNYNVNEGTDVADRKIDVSSIYNFTHDNADSLSAIEYAIVGFENNNTFHVNDTDLKKKLDNIGLTTDTFGSNNSGVTLTQGDTDYVESKSSLDTANDTDFYLPVLDYFQKPEIKLFMRARVKRSGSKLINGSDTQETVEKEFFLINVKVGAPSSNSFVVKGTNSLTEVSHSVDETLGVKEESYNTSYHNPEISLSKWLNNIEHQDSEGDSNKKFKLSEVDNRLEVLDESNNTISIGGEVTGSYKLKLKDNTDNKLDNTGDEKDFPHHDYERTSSYTIKYEVFIPRFVKLEGMNNVDNSNTEWTTTTNITSSDKLFYFESGGKYYGPLSRYPNKMSQLEATKAFVKDGNGKRLYKTNDYVDAGNNPPSNESAVVVTKLNVNDKNDSLPLAPQPYKIKSDVNEDYYTANPITQGIRTSPDLSIKEGVRHITNIYAEHDKLGPYDSEGSQRKLAHDLSDSDVGLYEGDTGYNPDSATTSNIDLLGFKLEFNHPWSNTEEAELVNTIRADNIKDVYTKAQLQFTKTAELGRIYKFTVAAITNMKPTNKDLTESNMNASGLYGFDNLEYPKYYLDYDDNNKPTFTSTKPSKDVELYVRRTHFVISVTDEEDIMVVSRNGVKVNKRLELAEEITFKYSDANVEEIEDIVDNKIVGVDDGNTTGDVRLFRQGDTTYLAYWDGVNWEIVQ
jgi:hypothetical protein